MAKYFKQVSGINPFGAQCGPVDGLINEDVKSFLIESKGLEESDFEEVAQDTEAEEEKPEQETPTAKNSKKGKKQ